MLFLWYNHEPCDTLAGVLYFYLKDRLIYLCSRWLPRHLKRTVSSESNTENILIKTNTHPQSEALHIIEKNFYTCYLFSTKGLQCMAADTYVWAGIHLTQLAWVHPEQFEDDPLVYGSPSVLFQELASHQKVLYLTCPNLWVLRVFNILFAFILTRYMKIPYTQQCSKFLESMVYWLAYTSIWITMQTVDLLHTRYAKLYQTI